MYFNRGDVDFFENGVLVEDEGNGIFDIIWCQPFDGNPDLDRFLFAHVEVDINDDWIDTRAVSDFVGGAEDDEDFALAALDYYGPAEFGDPGEELDRAQIRERLDGWYGEFDEKPWER